MEELTVELHAHLTRLGLEENDILAHFDPTSADDKPSGNMSEIVASTFTRFPDLPLELRLKIWKFSLPAGRFIIVKVKGSREVTMPSPPGHRIPAILQTCRESRQEALTVLQKLSFAKAYVDPLRDTIYFSSTLKYRHPEEIYWVIPSMSWKQRAQESLERLLSLDFLERDRHVLCKIRYLGMDWRIYWYLARGSTRRSDYLQNPAVFLSPFEELQTISIGGYANEFFVNNNGQGGVAVVGLNGIPDWVVESLTMEVDSLAIIMPEGYMPSIRLENRREIPLEGVEHE